MANEMKFKRYEVKFKINRSQYEKIQDELREHMTPDKHGRSTIFSLYFDTPDYRLIRRSMEHPDYKEKLRLRSYGLVSPEQPVFLELKKKYDKVVYKRRIEMTEPEAVEFCRRASGEQYTAWNHRVNSEEDLYEEAGGQDEVGRSEIRQESYSDRQIKKEIRYALQFYPSLKPRMLLSYEREAWYEKGNHDFRITFDQNLLWRETDLDLHTGVFGKQIIPEDEIIMEVKTGMGIPLWLTQILTREKIYKTSFSKYATAYRQKVVAEMAEKAFEATVEQILEEQTTSLSNAAASVRDVAASKQNATVPGKNVPSPSRNALLSFKENRKTREKNHRKRNHLIGGRKYA